MGFIANRGQECDQFFRSYLQPEKKALCVATLGFNDVCVHFPLLLSAFHNVDFLLFIEERPEVARVLREAAYRNRDVLAQALGGDRMRLQPITIVAADTANVAGRSAAKAFANALAGGYSDVFVDASGMSRGVCFPVVKQAYELARRDPSFNAHVLVAGRDESSIAAYGTSSDTPQYIHGFQADMDTDSVRHAIKLWIPQLSEGALASLRRIQQRVNSDEACPILPFPAANPRRGDNLLKEFQEPILDEWAVNLHDVIYAHEADPTDVCQSVTRIHRSRAAAFAAGADRPARTILSPAGWRIGSVGLLLAALTLDLPILYEESIGYTSSMTSVPPLASSAPDHLWHVWLRP